MTRMCGVLSSTGAATAFLSKPSTAVFEAVPELRSLRTMIFEPTQYVELSFRMQLTIVLILHSPYICVVLRRIFSEMRGHLRLTTQGATR